MTNRAIRDLLASQDPHGEGDREEAANSFVTATYFNRGNVSERGWDEAAAPARAIFGHFRASGGTTLWPDFYEAVEAALPAYECVAIGDLPLAPMAAPAGVRHRFESLLAEWLRQTAVTSSLHDMYLHPAYQQIIGLGPSVVPFVLRELPKAPIRWFWALESITGENPVPEGASRESAVALWLRWARLRGLEIAGP